MWTRDRSILGQTPQSPLPIVPLVVQIRTHLNHPDVSSWQPGARPHLPPASDPFHPPMHAAQPSRRAIPCHSAADDKRNSRICVAAVAQQRRVNRMGNAFDRTVRGPLPRVTSESADTHHVRCEETAPPVRRSNAQPEHAPHRHSGATARICTKPA